MILNSSLNVLPILIIYFNKYSGIFFSKCVSNYHYEAKRLYLDNCSIKFALLLFSNQVNLLTNCRLENHFTGILICIFQ